MKRNSQRNRRVIPWGKTHCLFSFPFFFIVSVFWLLLLRLLSTERIIIIIEAIIVSSLCIAKRVYKTIFFLGWAKIIFWHWSLSGSAAMRCEWHTDERKAFDKYIAAQILYVCCVYVANWPMTCGCCCWHINTILRFYFLLFFWSFAQIFGSTSTIHPLVRSCLSYNISFYVSLLLLLFYYYYYYYGYSKSHFSAW